MVVGAAIRSRDNERAEDGTHYMSALPKAVLCGQAASSLVFVVHDDDDAVAAECR